MDSSSMDINFRNTTNCAKQFYYCNEEKHTNLLKNLGLNVLFNELYFDIYHHLKITYTNLKEKLSIVYLNKILNNDLKTNKNLFD